MIGSFIGSLPSSSRQNSEFGLPLLLMPEQARQLVDKKIAQIVCYDGIESSNQDLKVWYDKYKVEFWQKNFEQYKNNRKETIIKLADKITEGKLTKMNNEPFVDVDELKRKMIEEEIGKTPELTMEMCPTEIFTKCPLENRTKTIIDWKYPQCQFDKTKCVIFNHLWNMNYYITNGYKFGCDYLVYEGDPSAFHSKYMIICKIYNQAINDLQIQIAGRLSNSVKKKVLIATTSSDYQIEYSSVEWHDQT